MGARVEEKKKIIVHTTVGVPDELITIYDIDYVPKQMKRDPPYLPSEKIMEKNGMKRDVISDTYKQQLLPDYERNALPNKEQYEQGDDYFNRLVKQKPSITQLVESSVNQDVLVRHNTIYNTNRTVYQVDYCTAQSAENIEDPEELKKLLTGKHSEMEIPDRWKPLPLTVYRQDYRSHYGLTKWRITPELEKAPVTSFERIAAEQKAKGSQMEIPQSEYEGVIGDLGHHIIKDEYHGHIPPLPGEFQQTENQQEN